MNIKTKKFIKMFIVFLTFFALPMLVSADDDGYEVVSETSKYYKTVTYYNSLDKYSIMNSGTPVRSETTEITKEEYDMASDSGYSTSASTTIEVSYKNMTSYILSNGSYYRYKNLMVWKSIPSLRSYDIIGIGFPASVKLHGNPILEQEYCTYDATCSTSTASYKQVFANGAGATFKLASGNLTSLSIRFYFDVEKNTTATITDQDAFSDYAHATSAVLLPTAMQYSVVCNSGIVLSSAAKSYYDSMPVADAIWSGTW